MYALTIRQPWAHCIFHHGKNVENRTWPLPGKLLGEFIAIHASAKMDSPVAQQSASELAGVDLGGEKDWMPLGHIVGVARLIGEIQGWGHGSGYRIVGRGDQQTIPDYDPRADKWLFGPHGFVLGERLLLPEPIKVRGRLGFWLVPDEIDAQITRQIVGLYVLLTREDVLGRSEKG